MNLITTFKNKNLKCKLSSLAFLLLFIFLVNCSGPPIKFESVEITELIENNGHPHAFIHYCFTDTIMYTYVVCFHIETKSGKKLYGEQTVGSILSDRCYTFNTLSIAHKGYTKEQYIEIGEIYRSNIKIMLVQLKKTYDGEALAEYEYRLDDIK